MPNRFKRALSPELKSRVLEGLLYLTARPGLAELRLRHKAVTAERRGDWAAAMAFWQRLALMNHPPRDPDDADADPVGLAPPQPDTPEANALRKTRHALTGLRRARARQALALYDAGRGREGDALVAAAVESLPDHRILKNDTDILAAAARYLQRALDAEGAGPDTVRAPGIPPRRIVFCIDVLKISEVHTHARVLFAICRNLLDHDPDLVAHLVVTRERFAVTTPIVSPTFASDRVSLAEDRARAALGADYGTRFHLHMRDSPGLEGVLDTCRAILDLGPDVVLYGGGHRGFYSNESRLVRHALFDHLPTAFFYIQSNNQVDPKLDMIIARGPHAIAGDPGKARVRVQPYPTIVSGAADPSPTPVDPAKRRGQVIVSAITGVRMNQRLAQNDRATIDTLMSILDDAPGAVWHFIGAADPEALARDLPAIGRRVAEGRVIVHPVLPFDAFSDLVRRAALFVHPPGFTGGSGGAAVARAASVPILTCRDSDVSGRQPPGTVFAANDMKGLARAAVRILSDDDAWAEVARAQIAHKDWIRRTAPAGFHDCLRETVEAFRARRGSK